MVNPLAIELKTFFNKNENKMYKNNLIYFENFTKC